MHSSQVHFQVCLLLERPKADVAFELWQCIALVAHVFSHTAPIFVSFVASHTEIVIVVHVKT